MYSNNAKKVYTAEIKVDYYLYNWIIQFTD